MKKLLLIPLLLLSLTTMAACSTTDDTPDTPSGNGNMLVLYFSAEGHTPVSYTHLTLPTIA